MSLDHLNNGKLLAIIGDEDTCVGFLLGGIGELDKEKIPPTNFMVVDKSTLISDVEDTFTAFLKRSDIEIILISQNIAETIRPLINAHTEAIPSILEIPSRNCPYDPNKDSVFRRAKGLINAEIN